MICCGFADTNVGRLLSKTVSPNQQKVFDTARKYYADLLARRTAPKADAAQPAG